MVNKIIEALVWLTVGIACYLIMNLAQKYLAKVYNNKKQEIELNKKKYPKKSFSMEENVNNHLLKSYVNSLKYGKWVMLIMGIIIFLRITILDNL